MWLPAILPFLPITLAATYTVQHRLLQPAAASEAVFKPYGTITIPETDEARSNSEPLRIQRGDEGQGAGVGGPTEKSWYQVLIKGGELGDGIMASTKGCYLFAGPPSIILHRNGDGKDRDPSGLELIPDPSIPIDGSCPSNASAQGMLFNPFLQAEVSVRQPHLVFGPDLAPPIPLTTGPGGAGGPAQPVEEKSFLQKYWLPLLGLGFFVISQLGPDDKPQQAAAGGAKR